MSCCKSSRRNDVNAALMQRHSSLLPACCSQSIGIQSGTRLHPFQLQKGLFTTLFTFFSPTINSINTWFLPMCCHHLCVDSLKVFFTGVILASLASTERSNVTCFPRIRLKVTLGFFFECLIHPRTEFRPIIKSEIHVKKDAVTSITRS